MTFPWQTSQWQQFCYAKQTNHLPHAILLSGVKGIGKVAFAESMTRALLCEQFTRDQTYCMQGESFNIKRACHTCRLLTGRVHPNVIWVEPEKTGQAIKVDQIRLVTEFTQQSSFQGAYRIVVINPASDMNVNAANALLKTLEEPPPGVILILISDQPGRLPATIRSRCQSILFPRPEHEQALAWLTLQLPKEAEPETLLALADGAPLVALALLEEDHLAMRKQILTSWCLLKENREDPLKIAHELQDLDVLPTLDFLLSWLIDLIRLQLSANINQMTNKDFIAQLSNLTQHTKLEKNVMLMAHLQTLRGKIATGINLNKQLMFEDVLIRWMQC